ncbi:MAG: DUF86 domain-containing protein [Nitrospirota bacterium]
MIDKTLIIRKINLISEDLKSLKPLAELSLEVYKEDPVNEVLAERYLERMIGRMIDINYHLITELDNPPPKDYYESFITLGRLKILGSNFAGQIAQSAGLRNRIAHEYDEIDEEKIYEGIKMAVRDMPEYLDAIYKFIQGSSSLS